MSAQIIKTVPPNFDEIVAALPNVMGKRGIIFAYAPNIYNPDSVELVPFLMAHEECHIHQQGNDPGEWWHRYLSDADFRFEQEFEAHIVEARVRMKDANRATRQRVILETVARLRNPIYGVKVNKNQLISMVKKELKIKG